MRPIDRLRDKAADFDLELTQSTEGATRLEIVVHARGPTGTVSVDGVTRGGDGNCVGVLRGARPLASGSIDDLRAILGSDAFA